MAALGTIWVVFGLSMVTSAPPSVTDGAFLLHEVLSHELRGVLWVLTGVAGLVFAWFPQGTDRWGFTSLIAMPCVYFSSYAAGWTIWVLSGGDAGFSAGWSGACVWSAVAWMIWSMVGWPEPVRPNDTVPPVSAPGGKS